LITISCPNILKYRDEWTRKKSKTPEQLRSDSGETPEQLRSKETETETDTETESDTDTESEIENNLVSFLPSVGKTLVNERVVDVSGCEPPAGSSGAEDIPETTPRSGKTGSRKSDSVPYQAIIDAYHEILPELPRASGGKEQRKHIRARWKESAERRSIEWWRKYFRAVRDQPFLLGQNDKGWQANLTWLARPTNMEKVLEGHYRTRSPTSSEYSETTAHNIAVIHEWISEKKRADGG